MAGRKKSIREKLDRPAQIVDMPPAWEKRFGKGKLLIPAPTDLEALVKRIPRGRVITQRALGDELARQAGARASCPITTGIFLSLIAQAAVEDEALGTRRRVAPWWRVVRPDGRLWDKSPGGSASQAERLREEGVEVITVRGVSRVAL